jgi:predicted DNA-binding transcriptional regulator YafY
VSPATEHIGKWDRAARYLKIAMILKDYPDGISAQALADRIGVSKRTVYRDVLAMDEQAGLPIWNDEGKFGLDKGAFLQPLALTLHEATTLFLAARMLAKASDEHDTELIGALVKLASILPPSSQRSTRFQPRRPTTGSRASSGSWRRPGPTGGWSRSSTTRASTTPRSRPARRASGRSRSNRRR